MLPLAYLQRLQLDMQDVDRKGIASASYCVEDYVVNLAEGLKLGLMAIKRFSRSFLLVVGHAESRCMYLDCCLRRLSRVTNIE